MSPRREGGPPRRERRAAGSVVAARPFGYVEPAPVIRRIGDRDLLVGNEHAADPSRHDRTFDAVVTASSEPGPLTTHHHPLVDDRGVDVGRVAAAVDDVRRLRTGEGSVLVHCTAGVSRSPALAAAAVALDEGLSLRAALDVVREARPVATPHPAVFEAALVAVASRRERGDG